MEVTIAHLQRVIREVVREIEAESARQPTETASSCRSEGHMATNTAVVGASLEKAISPTCVMPERMEQMDGVTPARIGIGRAGCRYLTSCYLDFLQAHAAARDAVLGEVPEELVTRLGLLAVTSCADTKDAFLTNPELGRHLSDDGKQTVQQQGTRNAKLQLIVIDGLSSTGMVVNLEALMQGIQQIAALCGYTFGKPIFVRHSRLAVTNEIGELLAPDVALSLVGERPGLVTAESVGAYVTWRSTSKTTEADRNLVSNIHAGGTPVPQALENIASLLKSVYAQGISGVKLK